MNKVALVLSFEAQDQKQRWNRSDHAGGRNQSTTHHGREEIFYEDLEVRGDTKNNGPLAKVSEPGERVIMFRLPWKVSFGCQLRKFHERCSSVGS